MTLAVFDLTERAHDAAPVARMVRQIAATYSAWRDRRARRLTLSSLLPMSDYQLRDLGITPHDVMRALNDRDCILRR